MQKQQYLFNEKILQQFKLQREHHHKEMQQQFRELHEEQWWHLSPPSDQRLEPGNKCMDSSNLGIVQPVAVHSVTSQSQLLQQQVNHKKPSQIPVQQSQMRSTSGHRPIAIQKQPDVPLTSLEHEVIKCSIDSNVDTNKNVNVSQPVNQQQQRASRSNKRHEGRYTSGNIFFIFHLFLLEILDKFSGFPLNRCRFSSKNQNKYSYLRI